MARAGIPSVPVPFAADQPFWARRLREAGIGSRPLDRRSATATSIGDALSEASSRWMRDRATEVGQDMAGEDAVGAVIDHLSRWHS